MELITLRNYYIYYHGINHKENNYNLYINCNITFLEYYDPYNNIPKT